MVSYCFYIDKLTCSSPFSSAMLLSTVCYMVVLDSCGLIIIGTKRVYLFRFSERIEMLPSLSLVLTIHHISF
jgi:hypothetical protein